jgi:alkanesulfonate monooxygenase SsuD/methylene tetrahydromethanopterin reductase-like flavin-dependent oxidoreductase (luciferase family)
MKLGYFTMPVHPPARSYVETLKEDREAFILADRLGYSEGYCGEHLTDAAENIPNSMLFIATLLGVTSQMKVGTAVVNLPHTHPVVVASNAAMLDNLFEGRFILGIGAGVLRSDAEALACWKPTATPCSRRRSTTFLPLLGRNGADRPQGQVLDHLDGEDAVARGRHRRRRQALSETSSADRRHRDRSGLQGSHCARPARLVADLLAFPASQLPEEPMGQLRQGMRRGRAQARSRELAGGPRRSSSPRTTRRRGPMAATIPIARIAST